VVKRKIPISKITSSIRFARVQIPKTLRLCVSARKKTVAAKSVQSASALAD